MFNITQVPQVFPGIEAIDFVVSVKGSVLTINGEEFDFSFMEKGDYLPFDGIEDENGRPHPSFFPRNIECDESDVINVSIYVPCQDPSIELPTLMNKKFGKVIEVHIEAIDFSIVKSEQEVEENGD